MRPFSLSNGPPLSRSQPTPQAPILRPHTPSKSLTIAGITRFYRCPTRLTRGIFQVLCIFGRPVDKSLQGCLRDGPRSHFGCRHPARWADEWLRAGIPDAGPASAGRIGPPSSHAVAARALTDSGPLPARLPAGAYGVSGHTVNASRCGPLLSPPPPGPAVGTAYERIPSSGPVVPARGRSRSVDEYCRR